MRYEEDSGRISAASGSLQEVVQLSIARGRARGHNSGVDPEALNHTQQVLLGPDAHAPNDSGSGDRGAQQRGRVPP